MSEEGQVIVMDSGIAHIHVSVEDGERYAQVRFRGVEAHRVAYSGSLRFKDAGSGWLETAKNEYGQDYGALYAYRADDIVTQPSSAGGKKLKQMLSAAVGVWERAHGTEAYRVAGHQAALERYNRLASEVADLEGQLDAKREAKSIASKVLKRHSNHRAAREKAAS